MLLKKTIFRIFLILGISSFINTSCNKDRYQFPYVPIYLNIPKSLLDSKIGQGEYIFDYDDAGVNGLIIVRNYNDQYFVYDRTCPYEPDYSCSVTSDSIIPYLVCPCCESQYFIDLSDDYGEAYVTRGPSRYPLKKYSANNNGGFITIVN